MLLIDALEHVNEKSGIFDYPALKDVTADSSTSKYRQSFILS